MIVFQDPLEQVKTLSKELSEQIKLIRALANFHVTRNSNGEQEDLSNQRKQIINSVKDMENKFEKLANLWNESIQELKSQTAYDPKNDSHTDLITKFVKLAMPGEMQKKWRPEGFDGSLLVFFKDSKINSSSLMEKKTKPGAQTLPQEIFSNNQSKHEKQISIVTEPMESFTVLKRRNESKVNVYFSLSKPAKVIIKIYNQTDELVRLIVKYFDEAGDFSVEWDGRDNDNEVLPKDIYYCQLEIGNTLSELKTISLK